MARNSQYSDELLKARKAAELTESIGAASLVAPAKPKKPDEY
jgi:hypothetical protein